MVIVLHRMIPFVKGMDRCFIFYRLIYAMGWSWCFLLFEVGDVVILRKEKFCGSKFIFGRKRNVHGGTDRCTSVPLCTKTARRHRFWCTAKIFGAPVPSCTKNNGLEKKCAPTARRHRKISIIEPPLR